MCIHPNTRWPELRAAARHLELWRCVLRALPRMVQTEQALRVLILYAHIHGERGFVGRDMVKIRGRNRLDEFLLQATPRKSCLK